MLARRLQRWPQTTLGKSSCGHLQGMSDWYIVEGPGSVLAGLAIPNKQTNMQLCKQRQMTENHPQNMPETPKKTIAKNNSANRDKNSDNHSKNVE